MSGISFRELSVDEVDKIKEINPSQYIAKAWREIDGNRQLIEINYQESDWPNGFMHHYANLKNTILEDGFVVGAFDSTNKLIGFASLNRKPFGIQHKYVLLDQLFISLEYRNQGIGKRLFMISADEAKKWGVDKIYICAGSAEETIAFYFAIGCEEAVEINKILYEADVRDFQLEYAL